MNLVLLTGHLGHAPHVTQFDHGIGVNFALATNENYKNKDGETIEKTGWHRIVASGKIAEIAEKYLTKGSLITIQGKLISRSYETKEGVTNYITEVRAYKIEFLGKKNVISEIKEDPIIGNEDDDLPF